MAFGCGLNDTWSLPTRATSALPGTAAASHPRRCRVLLGEPDQAVAEKLFADQGTTTHVAIGDFVCDPPDLQIGEQDEREGNRLRRQQLAAVGHLSGSNPAQGPTSARATTGGVTGEALTGSPDYSARIVLAQPRRARAGCSSDQYPQLGQG